MRKENWASKKVSHWVQPESRHLGSPTFHELSNRLKYADEKNLFVQKKPNFVMQFTRANHQPDTYLFEQDLLKIKVEPDRNKRSYFYASLFYANVFLFGASGFRTPEEALDQLFSIERWFLKGTSWMSLKTCYKKIFIEGLNAPLPPTVYLSKHLTQTFTRNHLSNKTIWFWESEAIQRKLRNNLSRRAS